MNSSCDIRSLGDCLIAVVIIHGNSAAGLDFGGTVFWHAESDARHNSVSSHMVLQRHLSAPTRWNEASAPSLHLGTLHNSALIKSKACDSSRPTGPQEHPADYLVFSVRLFPQKDSISSTIKYNFSHCLHCIHFWSLSSIHINIRRSELAFQIRIWYSSPPPLFFSLSLPPTHIALPSTFSCFTSQSRKGNKKLKNIRYCLLTWLLTQ